MCALTHRLGKIYNLLIKPVCGPERDEVLSNCGRYLREKFQFEIITVFHQQKIKTVI